jgi:large subunit ribosomal protein L4
MPKAKVTPDASASEKSSKIEATKIDAKGSADGTVSLDASLFGTTPNTHAMTLALHREWTHGKPHTACAKTRAEVRGGGKKPWKQKGTGRARAGSTRSPLWVGGGVTFGPRPRVVTLKLNRKVRVLVKRSVLSASVSKIRVVDNFGFINAPKTKLVDTFLKGLLSETPKLPVKILFVADFRLEINQNLQLAARNHPRVLALRLPEHVSVSDYLNADVIVISQDAIDWMTRQWGTSAKTAEQAA